MSLFRRILVFLLSIPAGILLLLTGNPGPTETYLWLLQHLTNIIRDESIQSIVALAVLALTVISAMGGLAVLVGGLFILRNHILAGRLLIMSGAGVGFFWLSLLMALITTEDVASPFTQYGAIGWMGLTLAFLAQLIATSD